MSEVKSDRERVEEMRQWELTQAVRDAISGDPTVKEEKVVEDVRWLLDFAYKATEPPSAKIEDLGTEPDAVEHPSHYNQGRFETIEVIEEFTKGYENGFVAHCVGTATKYISRAPYKHDDDGLEDLKKARQYLTFAIEHMERGV